MRLCACGLVVKGVFLQPLSSSSSSSSYFLFVNATICVADNKLKREAFIERWRVAALGAAMVPAVRQEVAARSQRRQCLND